MKKQNPLLNQEGFTLVEIIAVLIILGILAAVAVPRYIDLEKNAKMRAADAAVAELNGRESLTWADLKISDAGYVDDAGVWTALDLLNKDLGADYDISTSPNVLAISGPSKFTFKNEEFDLSRQPSTATQPATWARESTP